MAKLLKFQKNNDTYLDLADKYVARGEIPRALRVLRLSLLDEFSGEAKLAMAETYYNNGIYSMAETAFNELYLHPEYRQDALLGMYLVCLQLGESDRAAHFLNEMVKQGVNLPAEEMDELARFGAERAKEEIRAEYRVVYPESDLSKLNRASDAIEDGNPDGARQILHEIKEGSDYFGEARCNAALACLMMRDMDGAVKECMRGLRADSTNLRLASVLVSIFYERGQTALMNNLVEKMVQIEPKSEEEAISAGITMCQIGKHAQAVRYLKTVKERKYECNLMEFLAVALYNSGNREEALKVVGDVEAIYGEESNACFYRALISEGIAEHLPYYVEINSEFKNAFIEDVMERVALAGIPAVLKDGKLRKELDYALKDDLSPGLAKKLAACKAGRDYLKSYVMKSGVAEGCRQRAATELMIKGERPYLASFAVPQRVRGIPDFVKSRPGLRRAYCTATVFVTMIAPKYVNELVASARNMATMVDDFRFIKDSDMLAYLLILGIKSQPELAAFFSLKYGINATIADEYLTKLTQKALIRSKND